MRTRYALAILSLLVALGMSAKSAGELRIYINPGHGGWNSYNRPMPTVGHGEFNANNIDTCGFFESNTDLWKSLGMLDKLTEYGFYFDRSKNQYNSNPALVGAARDLSNNIFMSRVKNGPWPVGTSETNAYNRNLYEICCEVERNNFDFFISLHSDANNDTNVNSPGVWLRGRWGVALSAGSDEAGRVMWPYMWSDEHAGWSQYSLDNPKIIYDVDFWSNYDSSRLNYAVNNIDGKQYIGYYGVLRHGVKGFISETYHHTYAPERHRFLNRDVAYQDGVRHARALAAYFGIPTESTGDIYGIVRDGEETFQHAYYTCPNSSPDYMKPINGATVTLLRDGNVVSSYRTDYEWNGAFVFTHLEPGEYYVKVQADGYGEEDAEGCGPILVSAAQTAYPKVFIYKTGGPSSTREPAFATGVGATLTEVDNYAVSFTLNAAARARIVAYVDGQEQVLVPSRRFNKGVNNINVYVGDLAAGSYNWAVIVENAPVTSVQTLLSTGTAKNGVAVDCNPASPHYGNIYFSQHSGSRGIRQYGSDLSVTGNSPYFNWGWSTNYDYSCYRLGIHPSGWVMVSDYIAGTSGIYAVNPANPNEWVNMFPGSRASDGTFSHNGVNYGGRFTCADYWYGSGHDATLYTFQAVAPNGYNQLVGYKTGFDRQVSRYPEYTYTGLSKIMLNGNVEVTAHSRGVFLSEIRFAAAGNTEDAPAFLIADWGSNVLYNSGRDWSSFDGCYGALAVNESGDRMAVVDARGTVHVLHLSWNPFSLYEEYTFSCGDGNAPQAAFDPAGRLFIATRSGARGYALKQDARHVATPAQTMFVSEYSSGVGNVAVDEEAPVEYFNLQGIRVAEPCEGVYIRRQGSRVEKVVINNR